MLILFIVIINQHYYFPTIWAMAMVEVPCDNPVHFSLPVLTSLDGGPSHIRRIVSVQPLLAEHCKECRKERSSETREEDCLNLDNGVRGSGPFWKGGNVCPEGSVVDLV